MPPKSRCVTGGSQSDKELKQSDNGRLSSDKKELLELNVQKHKGKDPHFVSLCVELKVTDMVCDHAWAIWETVVAPLCSMPDTTQKHWGACLFISATNLEATSFTFTELQKTFNLNIKQFFNLLKKLDENLDISTKVYAAMTRLERKFDVLRALFHRFSRTCEQIFKDSHTKVEGEVDVDQIMRSCWTMFLLAKGRMLQMEDDLVLSFQLLICVLGFYVKRCPASLLQRQHITSDSLPTHVSRENLSRPKLQPNPLDLVPLEMLCKVNDCSADEVRKMYVATFTTFLDSLRYSESEDFPWEEFIAKQYEEDYRATKDFDARLFLDDDETLEIGEMAMIPVQITPKKCSQGKDLTPQTPVRVAMDSIQQLKNVLSFSSDQPSSTLEMFFKNCTVDPSKEITKRVAKYGQIFRHQFAQAVGQQFEEIGSQRFNLGVRLYYRVMLSMLESEKKRLSMQNFSKLLNNPNFHISLLACSLEVVMVTYGGTTFRGISDHTKTDLSFPWILDVFELSGFDFYKVIESFIKAEPSLSREMIKHLEHCEHIVMESIAWRSNSTLFEILRQSSEDEGLPEQAEPPAILGQPLQHNHTAADLYLSPVRPSSQVSPPDSRNALSAPSKSVKHSNSNSLCLFYKKLYRLAYLRLNTLFSQLLNNYPDLEPIMWTLLQHTLQNEYELLRDRHLDQLMMSSMYAICKVKNIDLLFKTIVTAYKTLPNTNQETFKRVLIRDGMYDSIIVFYNLVFMQKLKTNILQYTSSRPPTLSPVPQIPCSPYKYPSSPLRVPGSNNVYISPMKSSRISPCVTSPRSKILVSIGETFGTSDKFQKINQIVSSTDWSMKRMLDGTSAPKPLKRLRFDMDDQDEADQEKSNGESKLIQKLAEMNSTRSWILEQNSNKADSIKEES